MPDVTESAAVSQRLAWPPLRCCVFWPTRSLAVRSCDSSGPAHSRTGTWSVFVLLGTVAGSSRSTLVPHAGVGFSLNPTPRASLQLCVTGIRLCMEVLIPAHSQMAACVWCPNVPVAAISRILPKLLPLPTILGCKAAVKCCLSCRLPVLNNCWHSLVQEQHVHALVFTTC